MKRLFSIPIDVTDYLITNDVEPVAELVSKLSDMAKTASVHSLEERDLLDKENVALILYHPRLGEMKKFACNDKGITEININLLSKNIRTLPDEVVKTAAGNLSYVAHHLGIDIPENLQEYKTDDWVDPYIDITRLNKVAFYQKLKDDREENLVYALPNQKKFPIHDNEHVKLAVDYFTGNQNNLELHEKITFAKELTKYSEEIPDEISKYTRIDTETFSEDLEDSIHARLGLTHDEQAIELYNDILEKYSEYTPVQVAEVLNAGDKHSNMDRAISQGLIKNAAESVFGIKKLSWFEEHTKTLRDTKIDYLSSFEKEALLSEDGEDVFNSLPKPTKDRLIKDLS